MRERWFSVTAKDCEWTYMPHGGNGGQNANKNHTAARVVHRPSGAMAESREFKSQLQNRQAAFGRMARSDTFQRWLRLECARRAGAPSIDEVVARQMVNIRVEALEDSRWVEVG